VASLAAEIHARLLDERGVRSPADSESLWFAYRSDADAVERVSRRVRGEVRLGPDLRSRFGQDH
jgi:hypothetical protein